MINKLKSNRGATMILALALFLICVMVSSIILVVAASSSGRVSQQVKEQQAYLSVSSAADIVATELDRCNKYVLEDGVELVAERELEGVFEDLMNKAAFSVYMNHEDALKKEIQDYVKTHTAPYKYPRIVEFKDALPKTASGKIQRNKL